MCVAREPEDQTMVEAADMLGANVDALRRAQPDCVSLEPRNDNVRCIQGSWRLFDDQHPEGAAIHSRDPHREADRAASRLLDSDPPRMIVAIGVGLGYLLDALERRGWTGRVLALEPTADTVTPMLARRDWRSWFADERLKILHAPRFDGAASVASWFEGSAFAVYVNPALARLRLAEVESARTVLDRIRFNAEANANARRQFGGRYLLNTLANLRAIAREDDVTSLKQAAAGMPAIVVAAGPSLDRNLEAIRRARERAVIVAVDTALRPLLTAGVMPHVVVAVDPGEANARHLTELPRCPETYLVAEASLDPSALETFRGRTFLFSVSNHQPWPWLQRHQAGRGRVRAWGSVLTSAFDLAIQMGCTPIVFAGADLAFTGGRPYCRGNTYEEDWRRFADWGAPLEEQWQQQVESWPRLEHADVHGQPTHTAAHLVAFRDWLAEQIGRETGTTFVNGTGAGILHGERIEQQSLDQVVDALPTLPVLPGDVISARYRPRDGSHLLDAARSVRRDADTLRVWCEFADGLAPDRIVDTIDRAVATRGKPTGSLVRVATRPQPFADYTGIDRLVPSIPLVTLPIPPERLLVGDRGLRRFRFRTTIARVFGCVFELPDGGVLENGEPLRRVARLEDIAPGEYFLQRDELYILPADSSDPRHNGRLYAVLVPEPVAHVEMMPLADIVANRL